MSNSLREAYLVGNRLVKFLSTVLPTHPDYFKTQPSEFVTLRSKSQAQLVQLLQYLEQIALLIDEDQYNKYILQDLHNRMASSSSLQDTTLSSIEVASTSDASFSSLPPETTYVPPPPSSQPEPALQRPARLYSENVRQHFDPQHAISQSRPNRPSDFDDNRSNSSKGIVNKIDQNRHSDQLRQSRGIDLRTQQQYHSTSWDTSFCHYHGQPHTNGDRSYSEETIRTSQSHGLSKDVRLEDWNPQFPPLEDFRQTIAYVGDNYGQQTCSATTATTTSSSSSSAASSVQVTSKIEQRWIQAQRHSLRSSGEEDTDGDQEQQHPKSVKELRPWQSPTVLHHPLLPAKTKSCWPAPLKRSVAYYAAREGPEKDDEVELEFDDEESYLAGTARPGEEEASLTSNATYPRSNSQKSRRAVVVLKQFKGCVNCLVN
jgi:hypothetical protein